MSPRDLFRHPIRISGPETVVLEDEGPVMLAPSERADSFTKSVREINLRSHYVPAEGPTIHLDGPRTILLEIDPKGIGISEFVDGRIDSSYGRRTAREAVAIVDALIHGLPRLDALRNLDKQSEKTPPAPEDRPAA